MKLPTAFRIAIFVVLVASACAVGPARAQQQDVRDLIDRVDRLERDLNILQSQFYRSQSGSTTVITSPAAGAGAASGNALSTDVYNTLDQRISALEDQIKALRMLGAESRDKADALRYIIHFVGDMHQP